MILIAVAVIINILIMAVIIVFLNKKNNNGWNYFFLNYNGEYIELDKLRYLYVEENDAK